TGAALFNCDSTGFDASRVTDHESLLLRRPLPARPLLLGLGVQDEAARAGVLPHGRARPDGGSPSDGDRRDELHVGADVDVVLDHGPVLEGAVVITGDGARPDIDVAPDRGI